MRKQAVVSTSAITLIAAMAGSLTQAVAAAPATAATPAVGHAPAVVKPGLTPPDEDPFYDPPEGFEATAPGTVLKKREIDAYTYGIKVPAKAYQVLVRSTDSKGGAIANVSTVFVPLTPYVGPGSKRPLLSFQIATDSLGTECNPSYRLRQGLEKEVTGVYTALSMGWVSVITDYQGPKMAWSAGRVAGNSVLDGIRGTLNLPEAKLSNDTPVGAWGYSGGGQATAWAAQQHPKYAPELKVKGFAAGAFAGDLKKTLQGIDGGPFAGFAVAGAVGVSREYEELLPLFNAKGRQEAERIGKKCQIALVAANPFAKLSEMTDVDIYTDPRAESVFKDNYVGQNAPTAPVLIQQSRFDEIIRPSYNQGSYRDWCTKGANVEYRLTSFAGGHITYAIASIPGALTWLTARFADKPANSTCT